MPPEWICRSATTRPTVAPARALVAVRMVDDAPATERLPVVSPAGYRVDGPMLGQAAAFLRQLA